MARNSLKNVLKLIDESKKSLPKEQSFLSDLKYSIEISAQKHKRPGSKAYKPSSMNCIRQMYYIVTGTKADEESTDNYMGIGICNSGSDIHERIQRAVYEMKENGLDCEYVNVGEYIKSRGIDYLEVVEDSDFEHGKFETKLYHKGLNISFLCDGIIKYKGVYYILELKTESASKFFSRQGVDPSHYNQGTAYSLALQIPNVIFVYISRDVLEMKSFMFTPTDDMKQDLVGRIQTCDEYIAKLAVPPKPDDVPKKSCAYCNWKERCRKGG